MSMTVMNQNCRRETPIHEKKATRFMTPYAPACISDHESLL
jgi:hypothetical protein